MLCWQHENACAANDHAVTVTTDSLDAYRTFSGTCGWSPGSEGTGPRGRPCDGRHDVRIRLRCQGDLGIRAGHLRCPAWGICIKLSIDSFCKFNGFAWFTHTLSQYLCGCASFSRRFGYHTFSGGTGTGQKAA